MLLLDVPPRLKDRLFPGKRVRIRIARDAMRVGYSPCPDNTVGVYVDHYEANEREFAVIRLPSMAKVKIAYEHIAEVVRLDYHIHRAELIDIINLSIPKMFSVVPVCKKCGDLLDEENDCPECDGYAILLG
jgi:hypothetical protein